MRLIKLVTRSAIVCALLVLTPLTFTAEGGVDDNLACSEEQKPDCKRQIDSVCTAGSKPAMHYYTVAEL
jgi:hypothetical protein